MWELKTFNITSAIITQYRDHKVHSVLAGVRRYFITQPTYQQFSRQNAAQLGRVVHSFRCLHRPTVCLSVRMSTRGSHFLSSQVLPDSIDSTTGKAGRSTTPAGSGPVCAATTDAQVLPAPTSFSTVRHDRTPQQLPADTSPPPPRANNDSSFHRRTQALTSDDDDHVSPTASCDPVEYSTHTFTAPTQDHVSNHTVHVCRIYASGNLHGPPRTPVRCLNDWQFRPSLKYAALGVITMNARYSDYSQTKTYFFSKCILFHN